MLLWRNTHDSTCTDIMQWKMKQNGFHQSQRKYWSIIKLKCLDPHSWKADISDSNWHKTINYINKKAANRQNLISNKTIDL